MHLLYGVYFTPCIIWNETQLLLLHFAVHFLHASFTSPLVVRALGVRTPATHVIITLEQRLSTSVLTCHH